MKPFGEYFDRFAPLVQAQDRSILDSPMPLEFSHTAAARCNDLIFTICSNGNIHRLAVGAASISAVSAVIIHDYFEGTVIEEIRGKGSYQLPDDIWKKRGHTKCLM